MEEQNNQMNQQIQASDNHQEQGQQTTGFDISTLFKDNQPGVYDDDKVAKLAKDFENSKKSAQYFQSQYMKKEGVPDDISYYFKDFTPDSMYANAMEKEEVKKAKDDIIKFAHENMISPRIAEKFFDYSMKNLARAGAFTEKTEEQIQAEQKAANEEAMKVVQPMLDGLNRTLEQNNEYIEKFFESNNMLTTNPQIKEYLQKIANDGADGYMLVTLLEQAINHQGVPVVTGTVSTKDKVAFEKALAQETNPEAREKLMREFYGDK